jgi:SAM-dependent methyltransferase
MANYDDLFFDYVDSGAINSAQIITGLVGSELRPASVLDVGCGRGGWLSQWKQQGARDVQGIDGDYVDRDKLYIDKSEFRPVDLNAPFDLDRRFDIVQSVEVAEHLKPQSSAGFVACLVKHGDVIMFSAAPPGQGGTGHINERSFEYWRRLFGEHGYQAYDFVRPKVRNEASVEPWYRFNTFIYASETGAKRLSPAIAAALVPESARLSDVSPLAWRLRLAALRMLPPSAMDRLALINAKLKVGQRPH